MSSGQRLSAIGVVSSSMGRPSRCLVSEGLTAEIATRTRTSQGPAEPPNFESGIEIERLKLS